MQTNESVNTVLRTYLRRLTNLSGNNRSLFLLKLYADQLMDLHDTHQLNSLKSFDTIKALIAGKDIRLCNVLDSRVEANNEASKKLKKLQRSDRFIFEERGSNDLHVGWPFVRGKFSDGTPVRCPLIFFPVSIVQENNSWILNSRPQAGITFNKSFLLAYSFYNKVKLDDELLETNFEDFSVDSTAFRTELYELLKDKIELNFNADNFRDDLNPFKIFKRQEFDQTHRNGELKLYPEAVLGIFPQAGSQLVPDYLQLIENEDTLDLEKFFADKISSEAESENRIKEEKLFTPYTLDAYQEEAIKAVKKGKSIVVQGPPGTGKSQLICNLIADAIAAGKRALVVCQKRAALDVVYSRLQTRGLGDFVGLVHDFRNERKVIYNKLARQIDSIDEFQSYNRSIDVIQTERRFHHVCRTIDQITEELDQFKTALFDDGECGLSIKELYLTSDLNGETINVRQEYREFTFPVLEEFLRKLRQLSTYAARYNNEEYLWNHRKSFARYTFADLRAIEATVADVPAYQKLLEDNVQELIPVKLNIEDAEALFGRENEFKTIPTLLKNDVVFDYFLAMCDEMDEETSLLWFSNVERMVLNCFDGIGVESSLSADVLVKFQEALHQRVSARRNLFKLIRWELTSKDKVWLKRVLVANDLPYNKAGLEALEQRLDNRLNLEHHLTALKKKGWLTDLPTDYDQSKLKTWFTRQKLAIRAKVALNTLREVRKAINPKKYKRQEFLAMLRSLFEIVAHVPVKRVEWQEHLTNFQIKKLVYDPSLQTEFIRTLRKDFDSLVDYDKLKESLSEPESNIITRLYDITHDWDVQRHERLLQNSIRLCWIEHIESKYPYLRSVSSIKMEDQQKELQQLVEEKQKLSHDILLSKIRERVYESMEFNRLNNRVTYRDLYHQVTKKKKVWPLRRLVTEFQEELFRVMPCWMASPESVSAIFPMEQIFDIVIFDEASQCFAERGIPAMYRGKHLVVAGDDMQLKPNELYQVRWDEDEENPDVEVDSLLELAERYLPTVHLQGHYRSQSLELIDFSNRHFYEGRLRLLPDRNTLNSKEPGIEFHNVKGIWENYTNNKEAQAVVERVITFLKADSKKDIGVVTFNAAQQALILDLMEEAFMKEKLLTPASLFVKNIENVQGDEKDVIIFSVGYAPDSQNKMKMQFGSLSMSGGENRLNVAVTRAREKIILICSIEPEDLRTDDVQHEGPKLLKKYLQFAKDVYNGEFKPVVINNVRKAATWFLNSQLKDWTCSAFEDMEFETETLPLADLHFKKDGTHLGIVATDDARYYQSLSAKDSFAYLPALYAQRNWDYHMVFSRNLWQDRQGVEEELMRFIGKKALSAAGAA